MTKDEIKTWRTETGRTQNEAAEYLGLQVRHYQKLEAGHANVTKAQALMIARDDRPRNRVAS